MQGQFLRLLERPERRATTDYHLRIGPRVMVHAVLCEKKSRTMKNIDMGLELEVILPLQHAKLS